MEDGEKNGEGKCCLQHWGANYENRLTKKLAQNPLQRCVQAIYWGQDYQQLLFADWALHNGPEDNKDLEELIRALFVPYWWQQKQLLSRSQTFRSSLIQGGLVGISERS